MGLFRKKEKDSVQVEMTSEQKDKYMGDILDLFLDSPRRDLVSGDSKKWDDDLTETQLAVLNDSKYSSIKERIDEYSELYEKIIDIQEVFKSNSNIIKSYGIEIETHDFFWATYRSLNALLFAVRSEINGLDDFKEVYDELIRKEIKKSYHQAKCMEVIVNDDINQYNSYAQSLDFNNRIDNYSYLSTLSQKVAKKHKVISLEKFEINKGLKVAKEHAIKVKNNEKIKEQERIRNLNLKIQESMFSAVTKADEITRMLEDEKRNSSDSVSDDKNKSRY